MRRGKNLRWQGQLGIMKNDDSWGKVQNDNWYIKVTREGRNNRYMLN